MSPARLGAVPELPEDFCLLLQQIVEIGAPTGKEAARATAIERWLNSQRAGPAVRDELNNVVVDLSNGAEPVWLLDAHVDTVFADDFLRVVKDGAIWRCPGIVDDTLSVVALMLLIRELRQRDERWPLMVSFTVGEEGEGDLRGIRAVGNRFRDRLLGAWIVDVALDQVTAAAVGSKRWRFRWTAPGGHSWADFGRPNAIHAMGEWIAALASLAEWKPDQLSYNVGRIAGGSTVNSLAEQAECALDLRSIDPVSLERTAAAVVSGAKEMAARHSVQLAMEPIGERPAGIVPSAPPLVEWIRHIHDELGIPFHPTTHSTNANALLALGIPAVCTGLSIGGGDHTREEWLDLSSVPAGWRKLWKMVERVMPA